jgi:hypothetical protein
MRDFAFEKSNWPLVAGGENGEKSDGLRLICSSADILVDVSTHVGDREVEKRKRATRGLGNGSRNDAVCYHFIFGLIRSCEVESERNEGRQGELLKSTSDVQPQPRRAAEDLDNLAGGSQNGNPPDGRVELTTFDQTRHASKRLAAQAIKGPRNGTVSETVSSLSWTAGH